MLKLRRITDKKDYFYKKATELYKSSFPFHEQREEFSQNDILKNPEYFFCVIYDSDNNDETAKEKFVGEILYWETKDFVYIEHFCIEEKERGKGYGRYILLNLENEFGTYGKNKTIILEIDPPVNEISVRRKSFYERTGFVANKYEHIHPPYHRDSDGHKLVVMSYPDVLTEEEYKAFDKYLDDIVMKNVF